MTPLRRRSFRLVLLLAAAALLPPAGVQAAPAGAPSAAAVLRSLVEAPTLIDYEGTKIISVRRADRIETVTVLEAHKRSGKTRLEFLSPDAVAGRIVIDNGLDLWHYEPSLHMAFQGPTLNRAGGVAQAVLALREAYHVQVLGSEDVIGRAAFVLWLGARRGGDSRTLWVDQATGLALRLEERRRGAPAYVAYFTRISFSLNLPEALFRFRAPAGARTLALYPSDGPAVSLAELPRRVGFAVRLPGALPPGIRFVGASVAVHGGLTAAHLRYSDGAQPLSVFQAPARRLASRPQGPQEEIAVAGVTVRLADLGYFRTLSWTERGVAVTIVSAQPRAVLLALARELIGR